MTTIRYLKGDATCPQAAGPKIICHICNDRGGWGKGFVLAISRHWSQPEEQYRAWYNSKDGTFSLGAVAFVQVRPDIVVANMIGQHGMTRSKKTGPPIRYEAVERCLRQVARKAREIGASVHMPRIGCGLAGGKWPQVESIINGTLCAEKISVTVYDFE